MSKQPQQQAWEPSFEDYVVTRRVVFFLLDEMREQTKKRLSVACDPLVAEIVFRSSEDLHRPPRPSQLISAEGEYIRPEER